MDIDYLRTIGETDAFPLSIDSAVRDKTAFPTPAEYEVEFETPFTNVVGFDVLDASIPNTMYTVDSHNNMFSFAIRVGGNDAGKRSVDDYLSSLARASDFRAAWADASRDKLRMKFVGQVQIQDVRLAASPSAETVVVDWRIPVTPLPGIPDGMEAGVLVLDAGHTYNIRIDATGSFVVYTGDGDRRPLPVSRSGAANMALVSATTPFGGKAYGLADVLSLINSPFGDGSDAHYPVFDASGSSVVGLDTHGVYSVDRMYYERIATHAHELEFHNLFVEVGDHDITSLVEAIAFALPTFPGQAVKLLELSGTSKINPGNYGRQKKIKFTSVARFWLDMEKSTIRDILGFGELAASPVYHGINKRVFGSVQTGPASHSLEAPGVVTLVGERIIVMRCPQIEEHAYSSYSKNKSSSGLGVFKLYDATIAHLRFDFTKLARLDFHPIGKLAKIRLRFETPRGKLYDFKSADHNLYMVVRFLIPKRKPGAQIPRDAMLNPDYDPDVLRYMTARARERDESDTDSDQDLLRDEGHIARYYENRRRFMLREEAGESGSSGSSESESSESSESSGDVNRRS